MASSTKYLSIILLFLMFVLLNCQTEQHPPTSTLPTDELARLHCSSCHRFPDPGILDRATWKNEVLPKMGYMLGFRKLHDSLAHHFEEGELGTTLIDQAKVFHPKPILAEPDWERIRQWYLDGAPEQLEKSPKKDIQIGLEHFEVQIPEQRFSPPGTSLVHFMEGNKIMVGDIQKGVLLQYDENLQPLKNARVGEGAVHLVEKEDALWLTVMGDFLATDQPTGYMLKFPKDPKQPVDNPIKELIRPVHAAFGDLNGDGAEDVVISEFGKWVGRLSWWENKGEEYVQHILSSQTGAIRACLHDWNQDGRQDVIALFGQGREGIHIFYQQADGSFRDEEVISLHPSMGSTYFNLHDFNGDGFLDILYTAGDNADFRPIPKPYHGIYIFTNDGQNQFEQSFFYPLHGAYKAVPSDFDQDGDLDLAAISFFPDYKNQPEESFLYLDNQGDFTFSASTFENVQMGRWVSMDVGDYDEDGDVDIVLGSLAFEIPDAELQYIQKEWIRRGVHFIVLKNGFKKR